MESYETPQRAAARKAADELHALVHLDTVFGDLYLRRARELLAPHLGEADFRALSRAQTEADLLPDRIRAAMGIQDWKVVQELSARLAMLKRRLQETAEIRGVAQKVYDLDDVLVDPFSPGLRALAGVTAERPPRPAGRRAPAPRSAACARSGVGGALRLARACPAETSPWTPARTRRPHRAGRRRNSTSRPSRRSPGAISRPSRRSRRSCRRGAPRLRPRPRAARGTWHDGRNHDLTHVFPDEAIQEAGRLGLAPVHMESIRLDVDEPSGTPGARARAGRRPTPAVRCACRSPCRPTSRRRCATTSNYLDRPFVNSEERATCRNGRGPPGGGLRRPASRGAGGEPPMLEALGLDRRSGLSRVQIERALLENGNRTVEATGLDPRAFRLVCIPPDAYIRIGVGRDWASSPGGRTWTDSCSRTASGSRSQAATPVSACSTTWWGWAGRTTSRTSPPGSRWSSGGVSPPGRCRGRVGHDPRPPAPPPSPPRLDRARGAAPAAQAGRPRRPCSPGSPGSGSWRVCWRGTTADGSRPTRSAIQSSTASSCATHQVPRGTKVVDLEGTRSGPGPADRQPGDLLLVGRRFLPAGEATLYRGVYRFQDRTAPTVHPRCGAPSGEGRGPTPTAVTLERLEGDRWVDVKVVEYERVK